MKTDRGALLKKDNMSSMASGSSVGRTTNAKSIRGTLRPLFCAHIVLTAQFEGITMYPRANVLQFPAIFTKWIDSI